MARQCAEAVKRTSWACQRAADTGYLVSKASSPRCAQYRPRTVPILVVRQHEPRLVCSGAMCMQIVPLWEVSHLRVVRSGLIGCKPR